MQTQPIPSALSVAPLVGVTLGEVKPKFQAANPAIAASKRAAAFSVPPKPAKVSAAEKAAKKAANRAKIVNLQERGLLAPESPKSERLSEDTLLVDLTLAARAYANSSRDVAAETLKCFNAGLDRDDVIEAIIAGGLSESYARTIVSKIYPKVRTPGAGTKTSPLALKLADQVVNANGGYKEARKLLLAAAHYCKVQLEIETARKPKLVAAPVADVAKAA